MADWDTYVAAAFGAKVPLLYWRPKEAFHASCATFYREQMRTPQMSDVPDCQILPVVSPFPVLTLVWPLVLVRHIRVVCES